VDKLSEHVGHWLTRRPTWAYSA